MRFLATAHRRQVGHIHALLCMCGVAFTPSYTFTIISAAEAKHNDMASGYPLGSSSTPPPIPQASLAVRRAAARLIWVKHDLEPSFSSLTATLPAHLLPDATRISTSRLRTATTLHPLTIHLVRLRSVTMKTTKLSSLPAVAAMEMDISLSLSTPSFHPNGLDVSDQVDRILLSIRPRMDKLSRLHEKHLRPGFADKSSEEKDIEALALDITKDFRRCSRLVAGLASFTQHLIKEAKRNQSDVTVRQIALAQNVQTALATRVQDLSGAFRKQQSLYLRRMKGMEVRDRDIRAARGLAPPIGGSGKGKEPEGSTNTAAAFRDSEFAVREDIELSRAQLSSPSAGGDAQSNLLLFEAESTDAQDQEIAHRSKEINEIAKSIQELAQLFGDLQTLVIDQGTMLDRIDYNVELMSREMKGAVEELQTATRYQRRSGRRQCILFLCLCIAVLVALIVVKPFWRVFASSVAQSSSSSSRCRR